jgi:hypothetical protein
MTTIQAGAEPRTALPGGRGVRRSELTIISVIRHSLMGAQATGEVHRSHGGHYDVYQGGESFDDVIQVELEFLHRHASEYAEISV